MKSAVADLTTAHFPIGIVRRSTLRNGHRLHKRQGILSCGQYISLSSDFLHFIRILGLRCRILENHRRISNKGKATAVSGKDGNRGYLVQTVIALLESLQSADWERITLEPSHELEKVDIVREGPLLKKHIQVKSSIRSIGKANAEKWAGELEHGAKGDELELVLVGNCSQAVLTAGKFGRVFVPRPKNLDLGWATSRSFAFAGRFPLFAESL